MIFQRETLFDVIDEIEPLLERHHNEVAPQSKVIRLSPQWESYSELERAGLYVVFTCREKKVLVGYSAFFLSTHLQHGVKVANNDLIYLVPKHRKGTNAAKFIDFCETQLKALGAQTITYHVKLKHDWRPILNRRGYSDEEVAVVKIIQGE